VKCLIPICSKALGKLQEGMPRRLSPMTEVFNGGAPQTNCVQDKKKEARDDPWLLGKKCNEERCIIRP
jgi:hypothetical protein